MYHARCFQTLPRRQIVAYLNIKMFLSNEIYLSVIFLNMRVSAKFKGQVKYYKKYSGVSIISTEG